MRILVTGGTGTLGGYVLRELLGAGHEVSELSRTAPEIEGVKSFAGDIGRPEDLREAFAGQEAVIHMAAVPGPGRQSAERLMQVNLVGTVNALEAAVGAGVGRFVFTSSGAAMGYAFQRRPLTPQYLPLDEDHPCRPHDDYGLSKLLGELACRRYTDAFGLQTLCLRVHANWYVDRPGAEAACGQGWAKDLTVEELWAKRYLKTLDAAEGDWPVPGPPAPHKLLWAFTDARDAARALRLAAECESLAHEVFIISGFDTCSREETSRLVERRFPEVPLSRPLSGFETLWSHAKAKRLLGYEPRHTWRDSDFQCWSEALKTGVPG